MVLRSTLNNLRWNINTPLCDLQNMIITTENYIRNAEPFLLRLFVFFLSFYLSFFFAVRRVAQTVFVSLDDLNETRETSANAARIRVAVFTLVEIVLTDTRA